MFYTTEALLLTKNLTFSSHRAVIATFGKEFIKTKEIPPDFHKNLREVFRLRQAGDYGIHTSITEKQAQLLINQGRKFLEFIKNYLTKKEYSLKIQ